jgi:cytochrome c-type biogenesis protein CcmH
VPFFKDKFVFVAAIQANGSAMPLAAKKIKVSQLPITLTLSDMDALIPGHELSTSKEIKLVARLSLSGSATPLPGDWEVVSEPFKLKTENLKQVLIISQKRP